MQTDFTAAPEVVEAREIVERATQAAATFKIVTAQDYEDSAGMLKKVMASKKRLEDLRTAITGPLNASLKAVNDLFRAPAEKLVAVERQIKGEIGRYADEQDRIRREEQRKADEEARKQREKLEAQARKAEESGKAEKAETLQQRAETIVAPVIQREPPKVTGVSMREVARFEITDASQLPREYLVPDEKKIRGVVAALKTGANIPGVRVWMERQVAAGAA